jgi:hypothetical protein
MSVTFASGIIPTSVSSRLVISISRFSVTTKYLRHQVATFQPCHTASTAHRIQMIGVPPTLPAWAADSVTKPATSAPARITITGLITAIGCIRTAVTIFSLGRRYLLTSRGGTST